jgi:hypothetical protein
MCRPVYYDYYYDDYYEEDYYEDDYYEEDEARGVAYQPLAELETDTKIRKKLRFL